MSREFIIEDRLISDDTDCYVIAEIGHNHQGEIDKAKSLIQTAKQCGADAVKLQKRDNRTLYTRAMYDKPYDHENSFGPTYGEHREFLEFDRDEYQELQRFSKEIGITFFATAFDLPSANFLYELGVPAFKLASGDLKNIPLMKHVAEFQKPMIISFGGGTIKDVERVYHTIYPINQQLCFLQCTTTYPTPPEEMNLRVISTFRERFPEIVIGLSDHYNGIALAVAAFVLGARVIEKHFTLNHTWKGTDHAFSLEPIGMQKIVRDLRRTRMALGDGIKKVYESELPAIIKMGKSLYAARDLAKGHQLTPTDIAVKSPGNGIPPCDLENVIGRVLKKSLRMDDPLHYDSLL